MVVEARHIHHLGKTRLQGILRPVHPLGDGARRIQAVADVLQPTGDPPAFLAPLLGNLVADAPHDDAGVVAVVPHEGLHVLVGPFVEEPCIAVPALGIDPHVEALRHDHHPQRVAELHQELRRHIVRRADGIRPHVLHAPDPAYQGRPVLRHTERSEVVVEADPLDLPRHTVQLEALLPRDGNRADGRLRRVKSRQHIAVNSVDRERNEDRMLRCPCSVPSLLPVQLAMRHACLGIHGKGNFFKTSGDSADSDRHQLLSPVPSVDLCVNGKRGTAGIQPGRTQIDIPRVNTQLGGKDEFHRAVKACPGIPA